MFLQIQKLNKKNILDAEKFFWNIFCSDLKKEKPWTYNESLVARYLIEKNKNKYLSISHKKDLVFIWINNSKIWVDIEILKIRDKNLLNKFWEEEYNILWWKNWENFYTLWTAKESIIKYENLLLDDIEEIKCRDVEMLHLYNNKIKFSKKICFTFWYKEFMVYTWSKNSLFYSICV
jgi:phosphopantetheinyl transferase